MKQMNISYTYLERQRHRPLPPDNAHAHRPARCGRKRRSPRRASPRTTKDLPHGTFEKKRVEEAAIRYRNIA